LNAEFCEASWESDEVEENMVAAGSHTMMLNSSEGKCVVMPSLRKTPFDKRGSTALVPLVADQHEHRSSRRVPGSPFDA